MKLFKYIPVSLLSNCNLQNSARTVTNKTNTDPQKIPAVAKTSL